MLLNRSFSDPVPLSLPLLSHSCLLPATSSLPLPGFQSFHLLKCPHSHPQALHPRRPHGGSSVFFTEPHFRLCLRISLLGVTPCLCPFSMSSRKNCFCTLKFDQAGEARAPPSRSLAAPGWPPYPPGLSAAGAPASHTQTPAPFELPFFFPFCRDFMAGSPRAWLATLSPQDLRPTSPPWDPKPAFGLGLAPGGQGSRAGGGGWPGQWAAAPASGAPATRK